MHGFLIALERHYSLSSTAGILHMKYTKITLFLPVVCYGGSCHSYEKMERNQASIQSFLACLLLLRKKNKRQKIVTLKRLAIGIMFFKVKNNFIKNTHIKKTRVLVRDSDVGCL